jgi:NAD(P)-dependent dehydrogenase (short-subunit alcohol dehydrogenase family)
MDDARYFVDLRGRTALITGASSGIGRRLAAVLAKSGANVVIAARRAALLDELAETIEKTGGKVLAVQMDVTDESSVHAGFAAAEARFGPVDSVIANAGTNTAASALKMALEEFDKVVNVNLRGVFLTVREGARRMIAAGSAQRAHGRIVIVSSITSERPYVGIAAYSATKAAVVQLGRVAAKEWASRGINVNVICPGFMQTELTDELWDTDFGRCLLSNFPRRRIMDASALDTMVPYLVSDLSSHVTGSVITIDDGQTLA